MFQIETIPTTLKGIPCPPIDGKNLTFVPMAVSSGTDIRIIDHEDPSVATEFVIGGHIANPAFCGAVHDDNLFLPTSHGVVIRADSYSGEVLDNTSGLAFANSDLVVADTRLITITAIPIKTPTKLLSDNYAVRSYHIEELNHYLQTCSFSGNVSNILPRHPVGVTFAAAGKVYHFDFAEASLNEIFHIDSLFIRSIAKFGERWLLITTKGLAYWLTESFDLIQNAELPGQRYQPWQLESTILLVSNRNVVEIKNDSIDTLNIFEDNDTVIQSSQAFGRILFLVTNKGLFWYDSEEKKLAQVEWQQPVLRLHSIPGRLLILGRKQIGLVTERTS